MLLFTCIHCTHSLEEYIVTTVQFLYFLKDSAGIYKLQGKEIKRGEKKNTRKEVEGKLEGRH